MPFSYAQYAGNGSTTTFSVPFPYLLKAHVKLYTGFNILSGAYTTLLVDGTDYTWTSTTQVQTTVAPANGVTLTVLRDTPDSSQLVPWQDGSNLVADDMNIADLQNLYVVQEQQDRNDVGITQSTNAINAANNAVATANAAAAAVTNVYLRDGSLPMTADVATGGFKVRDVGAPAVGTDAATKSYVDNFVGSTANIANGAVTTAKLADSSVTSAKIADGTIVAADLATDSVTTAKITDGSVTEAKLATDSVTTAKVANAAVTAAKLATDSVTTAKVADGAITNVKLADADLQTLAGAQTGAAAAFAALTAAEVATLDGITSSTAELNILDGVTADATEINKLDGLTASTSELSQLAGKTISGTLTPGNTNDIPTSSAVNSWVSNLINALGGFVAIANRNSFPTENPDPSDNAGTVVSIADAGGLIVSAGGTATNAQTTGAVAVTITGFPAAFQSKTLNAGLGIQVQTTTTLNTYTFHKSIPTDADIAQLSDDVNDFFARYRVGTTNPTTDLDAGDLFFNTSTGKMLVYDGTTSSWEEVQSIGNFNINTLSSSAGTGGGSASFNGTAYRFTLSNPPLFAQQLLVSVNGVLQKPNSGTSQPAEGFAIDGNDIVFSQAPATSSPFFIVTMGSTVNIGTPSDGTVSTAKLADSAVTTAKIDNGAVTTAKLGSDLTVDLASGSAASPSLYFDANTGVYSPGEDQVAVATNGVQRINIEADGDINIDSGGVFYDATNNRLAIGTTSPGYALDVQIATSSANTGARIYNSTAGTGNSASLSFSIANAFSSTNQHAAIQAINENSTNTLTSLAFLTTGSSAVGNATERARIDSSGRLLVGTSTALTGATAQYSKNVNIGNSANSAGNAVVTIGRGTAAASLASGNQLGSLYFTDNGAGEFASIDCFVDATPGVNDYPGRLVFSTCGDGSASPTERMRISNNGNVFIGKTSDSISDPGLQLFNGGNFGRVNVVKTASGTYDVLAHWHSGAYVGGITYSNTATALVTSSDARLKINVQDSISAINIVEQVRVISHDWVNDDSSVRFGFIAQELNNVLPEAVRVGDSGEEVEQTWGVDYARLVPVLTKALQEALTKIETLEARLSVLEAQ